MSGPLSPWLTHAYELLADGEWREHEWLVRQMAEKVPPGRAIRANEAARVNNSHRPARKILRSDEFLIRAGRRTLVVNTLVKSSRIEGKTVDGIRYWRLKP